MPRRQGRVSASSRRGLLTRVLANDSRPGADLTFGELLARYRAAYPGDAATHDTLSSTVSALVHDGALARTGARGDRTTYRFVPDPPPRQDRMDTLRDAARSIIDAHHRRERTPMPTGAVRAHLREAGLWPDRWTRLHALLSSMAGGDAPTLRRVVGRTASGRPAAFWLPAAARPSRHALPVPNDADALRRAVGEATAALGRPVSLPELRWWLDAQPPAAPLRAALVGAPLARILGNTGDHDARYAGLPGRLHVVTGPLTCFGGAPVRYALHALSDEERLACRLADALLALRLHDELEALDRLALVTPSAGAEARSRLAALHRRRSRAAATALLAHTGGVPRKLACAAGREEAALHTLAVWVRSQGAAAAGPSHRDHAVRARLADVAAARRLLAGRTDWREQAPGSGAHAAGGYVGRVALFSLGAIRRVTAAAIERGEIGATRAQNVYRGARRFPATGPDVGESPGPAAGAATDRRRSADELSRLDRVDAVTAVIAAANAPRARRIVRAGHELLGDVLRDVRWLQGCLTRLTRTARRAPDSPAKPGAPPGLSTGAVRRALVTALGLLGACPDAAIAVPDRSHPLDTEVYIVAVLTSHLDRASVVARVRKVDARARGRARAVSALALAALAAGRLLTLVERDDHAGARA